MKNFTTRLIKKFKNILFRFANIKKKLRTVFIYYFYIKNRFFWKRFNKKNTFSNGMILAEETGNIFLMLGICLLSNIISKVFNSRIVFLRINKYQDNIIKIICKSFSDCYFENIDNLTQRFINDINSTVNLLYQQISEPSDILNIRHKGVLIGDVIYDESLRCGAWNATVWNIDNRVKESIFNVVKFFTALEVLDKKYNIVAENYSHNIGLGAVVHRYFTKKGIKGFCGIIGSGPIKKYLEYNGNKNPYVGEIPQKVIHSIMNNNTFKANYLEKAEKYICDRRSGLLSDLDSPKAFNATKKTYFSKKIFCFDYNLDPSRINVFIMLHAFNDYPHHFEENIFVDYYHWFTATLDLVKNIKNINWIFKEHPSSKFYPTHDIDINQIFKKVTEENIIFLNTDDNFNSISITNVANMLVTCCGTAGLEYSCDGIPTLLAGENHFSKFDGIVYRAKTYEEYKNILMNVNNFITVRKNKIDIEKAKILFYLQYGIVTGSTNNNCAFLGLSTHEERLKTDMKNTLLKYMKELKINENRKILNNIEVFIKDKNKTLFFNDQQLAGLE